MVHCPKCQVENVPTDDNCIQCGASLLPGHGIGKRLGSIGGGIAAGLVSGALFYAFAQMEEPPFCCPSPQALLIGVVVLPIAGLVNAVRQTPLHERYTLRARRHVERDPEQALADFDRAMESAPERARPQLLKERAALYQELGLEEEATRDRLAYTVAPGAYEDEFGGGLMKAIGEEALDGYVQQTAKAERKRLVRQGKVKALGYCRTCRGVVELDGDLRCSVSAKHAKSRRIRFVMPNEVGQAKGDLEDELERSHRRRRTLLIVAAAVTVLLILACILFGVLYQIGRP